VALPGWFRTTRRPFELTATPALRPGSCRPIAEEVRRRVERISGTLTTAGQALAAAAAQPTRDVPGRQRADKDCGDKCRTRRKPEPLHTHLLKGGRQAALTGECNRVRAQRKLAMISSRAFRNATSHALGTAGVTGGGCMKQAALLCAAVVVLSAGTVRAQTRRFVAVPGVDPAATCRVRTWCPTRRRPTRCCSTSTPL
jgi:hypothetical protein